MVFSAIQAANFYRLYILGAGWPLHPWKAGDLSPEKAKSLILGKSWYIRGSLLQSDHELSSIINQRAPERPSLGRGQLET